MFQVISATSGLVLVFSEPVQKIPPTGSNQKLQQRLFDFYPGKRHEIHIEGFEKDPMRLIYLDDTHCARDDVIHSEIRLAVNRPRPEPAQGQSRRTKYKNNTGWEQGRQIWTTTRI